MFSQGYRIVATGVPRMTAAKPTCSQPAAANKTMLFNGFIRVAGAAWIEATVICHHRADGIAVELDRHEGQFTHWDCWQPLLGSCF